MQDRGYRPVQHNEMEELRLFGELRTATMLSFMLSEVLVMAGWGRPFRRTFELPL